MVDIIRQIAGIHVIHIDGSQHNRKQIRVDLHDHRRPDRIIPVPLELIELLLDLNDNGIHIGILLILEHDHGITVIGGGRHIFDIGRRRHRRLDRGGHIRLYLLRTRAEIGRDDERILKAHVRQQIRRHAR